MKNSPENSFDMRIINSRWRHDACIHELTRTYQRTSLVPFNDAAAIYAVPEFNTAIATSGLWSCTATVVIFDGLSRRGAALSHYDPNITTFSKQGLDDKCVRLLSTIAKQPVKAKAIIIGPGVPDPSSPTGSTPKSDNIYLVDRLKSIFGEDLPVSNVGYSCDSQRKNIEGTVLVGFGKKQPESTLIIGGVNVSGKI